MKVVVRFLIVVLALTGVLAWMKHDPGSGGSATFRVQAWTRSSSSLQTRVDSRSLGVHRAFWLSLELAEGESDLNRASARLQYGAESVPVTEAANLLGLL